MIARMPRERPCWQSRPARSCSPLCSPRGAPRRAALKDSNDRLADGLAAGQVIAFEWDAVTGRSRRSGSARLILGDEDGSWSRQEAANSSGTSTPTIVRASKRACARSAPTIPRITQNFRFPGLDGREVWLEEAAKGEFDATGQALAHQGPDARHHRTKAGRASPGRAHRCSLRSPAISHGSAVLPTMLTRRNADSAGYATIHGLPETTEIERRGMAARCAP